MSDNEDSDAPPVTVRLEMANLKSENEGLKREVVMLQDNIKAMSDFLNKGGHAARKRRKKGAADDIDACSLVVESVLLATIWPKRKFLPKTWKEWKPDNKKSTSSVLIGTVEKNIPSCFTKEVFWHVYMIEICGRWFVNRRNADTCRMKAVHARK